VPQRRLAILHWSAETQYDVCRKCEWMPTVLKEGSYRFFFYAGDRGEPPHIHVERENKVAKFWVNPPRLARSGDFGRAEIRRIEQLVVNHREKFLEAWNEFFGD